MMIFDLMTYKLLSFCRFVTFTSTLGFSVFQGPESHFQTILIKKLDFVTLIGFLTVFPPSVEKLRAFKVGPQGNVTAPRSSSPRSS